MVTHWRYQSPDNITSLNPYLSAPISIQQYFIPSLISIEWLDLFLDTSHIPYLSLCSVPSRTALFIWFHLFIKAVCPTHSFITWLIFWHQLIHFSHGPIYLCLLLIHSFTRPTLIPICSQIVLTLLISLCFLIISFMGRCSPVWVNNRVDTSSHTSLFLYLSRVWLAEHLPSFVISGSPLPFCTSVLTV